MNKVAAYSFDEFQVDVGRRRLIRKDQVVSLPRKAFEVLLLLLQHRGDVVDKETFLSQVWADCFVEENNLNQAVSTLRRMLGDNPRQARYIETVSKIGYRFLAPVAVVDRKTPESQTVGRSASARTALAVLPFEVLGEAPMPFLGLGMADALVTRLSRLRDLVVRPTSAVVPFLADRGEPLRAVRELGVDAVVEGKIRMLGGRIRVNVQVADPGHNEAIWAATFDEVSDDLLVVEDSIAQRVAEALSLHLGAKERNSQVRPATQNRAARDLYLKGRYFSTRLTRESFEKSVEYLQQAIALDPNYALPYDGLAFYYLQTVDLCLPPEKALPLARRAALRALSLDPELAEAHCSLASVYWFYDRNWELAESHFLRSLRLDPNNEHSRRTYSLFLTTMGRFEEGLEQALAALEVNPLSAENSLYLTACHYFSRRFDEAVAIAGEAVAMDPAFWLIRLMLGRALEQLGDLDEAIRQYREAVRLADAIPEPYGDLGRALGRTGQTKEAQGILDAFQEASRWDYVPPFMRACVHVGMGDLDEAMLRLRETCETHSWFAVWLSVDPALDPLRSRSDFEQLLRKSGL